MRRIVGPLATVAVLTALLAAPVVLGGCSRKQAAPSVEPKVTPPAIGQAGTLKVAVDLEYPPFAGEDNGQQVGIDVDVASALAERLGLKVELVDVRASDVATALADGTVDIAMSVPLSATTTGTIGYAGTYISDAPVLFAKIATASVEPSITIKQLGSAPVGAQYSSAAFWYLQDQLGEQAVKGFSTLREPLGQVSDGALRFAAGGAIVGAYIARDLETVRMVGQLQPAALIGIGVRPDNAELQEAVRAELDQLNADGILSTIRMKWVGDLPKLKLPASAEGTATP